MPAKSTSVTPLTADYNAVSRKPAVRATEDRTKNSALSISPRTEDHAALRRMLDELAWEVSAAANCHEAIERLRRQHVSVVLCDSVLEDGTWKDILNHISRAADPPLLIVTSRLADEYLWAEVLNLGGYDVLAKPFNQREVSHVLTTASLCQVYAAPHGRSAGAD